VQKPRILFPIVVEGKYDKNTIMQIFDATVITTGGFSIFNSKEKQALLRRLAERGGIILLTDSDGGGRQIRSFLTGILPKDKIYQVYTPTLAGKERRKSAPSKAGILGVEGMGRDVLERVLAPFVCTGACEENTPKSSDIGLTKLDFYRDGLSGGENSAALRDRLACELGLPHSMSASALIEAINLLISREQYEAALRKIKY